MAERDFYIDRLRTVMTVLVILHHTANTYGAPSGWFWTGLKPSGPPSGIVLTLFATTNQSYFMGLFFLLAGYFTPASLEKKGYLRFIGNRLLRLGLPLLAFVLLLGPLTSAIVNFAQGHGFWPTFGSLWQHRRFINGPLWFAQALLLFSLAYCLWRAVAGLPLPGSKREPRPIPRGRWWLLSALATGVAGLAVRQLVPAGVNVFGLQLGYFASYIFLFVAGIAAWRYDWLRQLKWTNARMGIVVFVVAWPCLAAAFVVSRALPDRAKSSFSGGHSWAAITYALWEPFVAWGIIALWLLVFRDYLNRPSVLWNWLNRRAYAVYILHPLVLVCIALPLNAWAAPVLVKFGVVGLLACIATWLLADPIVRLPGVRSVV